MYGTYFLNICLTLYVNTNPFVTMKLPKLATTIIFVLCCVIPCFAQYEEFYKVGNNTYVTTAPNAELYELSYTAIYDLINGKPSYLPKVRDVIDVSSFKIKRIKKPQQLKVLKYTNTSKQQGFNAYIVDYKDKYYVLYNCDVQDNTAMNDRSAKMLRTPQNLETQKQQLAQQLDSLVAIYYRESNDSLNYYKNLKTKLPAIRDSLENIVAAKYQKQRYKTFNEWLKKQTSSVRKAASIIRIDKSQLRDPNTAGGCDYHLCYTNVSAKTIKYLYWTGEVYNRVNDPVYCEVRGSSWYTGVDTGPVSPGSSLGGGVWECIVYNYAADTVKLHDISIDFTDGSHASLSATDIRTLTKAPRTEYKWALDTEECNEREGARHSVISDEICDKKIKIWEERVDHMKYKNFFRGTWEDIYHDKQYNEIYKCLGDVKSEIAKIKSEIERFEKFINFERY